MSIDNIQKNKNSLENHGKCVPLELYQKVYNDRKELLEKINNFNLIMKQKESEKILLQIKIKKYEKERKNNNTIILNQEKYVNQLNKKIEKFESIIMKCKEEIINKENEIVESKEKMDEFQNDLENYKNLIKLESKQKIDQINEKLILLNKEIELKNNKIDNLEKKYKFLQEKYLKTLNEKKILDQENVYKNKNKVLKRPMINKLFKISASKDDIFNFLTSQTNTINQAGTARTKHKEKYENDFFDKDNDDKDKRDNNDAFNKNILPNIDLSKSTKFNKSEQKLLKKNLYLKNKNNENSNRLICEKNNDF